jgi:hypothetical protein
LNDYVNVHYLAQDIGQFGRAVWHPDTLTSMANLASAYWNQGAF